MVLCGAFSLCLGRRLKYVCGRYPGFVSLVVRAVVCDVGVVGVPSIMRVCHGMGPFWSLL